MLKNIAIGLGYLGMIVLTTRIAEFGFWWDTGYTTFQNVDPQMLSIPHMKTLLNVRGIHHANLIEKSEFIETLQKSGPVQYGELHRIQQNAEGQSPLEIYYEEEFNKQVVNPQNLKMSQIKTLLDTRGIKCTALVEKSEFIELLQKSGPVHFGELYGREHNGEVQDMLEIYNGKQFHKQVVLKEESFWLLEIIPGRGHFVGQQVLKDQAWNSLLPKLKEHNIRSARVNCNSKHPTWCTKSGWDHPQLLLFSPKKNKYYGLPKIIHPSADSVLLWLQDLMLEHFKIKNVKLLEEKWLNVEFVAKAEIPHVVYFSELESPPLSIATLFLQLSNRAKLGIFPIKQDEKEQVLTLLNKSGVNERSRLVVVTSEGITAYGEKKMESWTKQSLDLYISMLLPDGNDVFYALQVMVHVFAIVDYFHVIYYSLKLALDHVISTLSRILVYFLIIFILGSLIQMSVLQSIFWLIGLPNFLNDADQIRYHWLMLKNYPMIFWMSTLMYFVILYIWKTFID